MFKDQEGSDGQRTGRWRSSYSPHLYPSSSCYSCYSFSCSSYPLLTPSPILYSCSYSYTPLRVPSKSAPPSPSPSLLVFLLLLPFLCSLSCSFLPPFFPSTCSSSSFPLLQLLLFVLIFLFLSGQHYHVLPWPLQRCECDEQLNTHLDERCFPGPDPCVHCSSSMQTDDETAEGMRMWKAKKERGKET